tara:strand:- start:815 stop:1009 length:195 start_codon:yes stop_codon:yes gene_type:complete
MSSQNGKIDSSREENFDTFCVTTYKLYLKKCIEDNVVALDFDEWYSEKFKVLNSSFDTLIENGD